MEKDNKNINSDNSEEINSEDSQIEQAPSEEVVAKEAPAEEVVAKEAPAEEVVAKEAPAEEVVAKEAPAEEVVAKEAPAEEVVAKEDPVEKELSKESVRVPFIIGKKIGMTRLFDDEGISYPVTVVKAGPCYITQVKSIDKDGYSAVQVGYDEVAERKLTKPRVGHLKNADSKYLKYLKEYKSDDLTDDISIGGEINVGLFKPGDFINISGISKGKGFAGHMKRHGFSGGRASHGKNSVMRKPGSIGAGTDPAKVWKGTRMAGRMGNNQVTVKNLEVIEINNDENTIFLNGSVPGSKNGIVYMSKVL
jgi:large subunit ribosomal protein L3